MEKKDSKIPEQSERRGEREGSGKKRERGKSQGIIFGGGGVVGGWVGFVPAFCFSPPAFLSGLGWELGTGGEGESVSGCVGSTGSTTTVLYTFREMEFGKEEPERRQ